MKKMFTLLALLACFMGAKADWVTDYTIDYSTQADFPFYVMGYAPAIIDGAMVDNPVPYRKLWRDSDNGFADVQSECTETSVNGATFWLQMLNENPWRQYFIADGIKTELDGSYTVKAMVKSSVAVTINVNMGWGWGDGQQKGTSVSIPQSDDFVEVQWEYSGIGGSNCNLVAQPGTTDAVIQWKSLEVSHNQKETHPTTWQEWLTSDGKPVVVTGKLSDIPTYMGDAEKPWSNPNCAFNDQSQNYLICAWTKERGVLMNEDGGWDPYPSPIETVDGSKVFVVHGKAATTDGAAAAWDNQFWIQSPKEWKIGDQVKISFRYKASKNVTVATQVHNQNPSDYCIWHAIGDVNFTTEWQEFENTMTISDDMKDGEGGIWSVAFQLNENDKDAIDFYFDNLSWQSMLLDEGYFVAGCNTATGLEYDFANAIQFEEGVDGDGLPCLIATVGTKGDKSTWVSQIMISTVRGNDSSFKSNTLKPKNAIQNDPSDWNDYEASSLAKLNLPAQGVWKIYIDPGYGSMAFELIEGEAVVIKEINPNPTEITVEAGERDYKPAKDDGSPADGEDGIGTGQPWDNQFWIVANRTLSAGETVTVKFKYKADKAATVSTQCHGEPGAYLHWAAIGNVNFTEDWQDFENTFTVAGEANGMKSIAFNLSEIKGANNYYIKDIIWMLEDGTESLIAEQGIENEDGSTAFVSKVNQGDNAGQILPAGISAIVDNKKVSNVTYNLAGQRVTNGYKGIVIKNGSKYIAK